MTTQTPRRRSETRTERKLSTAWDKFGDKNSLKAYLNSEFTKYLLSLLDDMEKSITRNNDYDSPAWAYQQADNNGQLTVIKKIRKILDHE